MCGHSCAATSNVQQEEHASSHSQPVLDRAGLLQQGCATVLQASQRTNDMPSNPCWVPHRSTQTRPILTPAAATAGVVAVCHATKVTRHKVPTPATALAMPISGALALHRGKRVHSSTACWETPPHLATTHTCSMSGCLWQDSWARRLEQQGASNTAAHPANLGRKAPLLPPPLQRRQGGLHAPPAGHENAHCMQPDGRWCCHQAQLDLKEPAKFVMFLVCNTWQSTQLQETWQSTHNSRDFCLSTGGPEAAAFPRTLHVIFISHTITHLLQTGSVATPACHAHTGIPPHTHNVQACALLLLLYHSPACTVQSK